MLMAARTSLPTPKTTSKCDALASPRKAQSVAAAHFGRASCEYISPACPPVRPSGMTGISRVKATATSCVVPESKYRHPSKRNRSDQCRGKGNTRPGDRRPTAPVSNKRHTHHQLLVYAAETAPINGSRLQDAPRRRAPSRARGIGRLHGRRTTASTAELVIRTHRSTAVSAVLSGSSFTFGRL
jgi:hypothetical protein